MAVTDALSDEFGLTAEEHAQMIPSGSGKLTRTFTYRGDAAPHPPHARSSTISGFVVYHLKLLMAAGRRHSWGMKMGSGSLVNVATEAKIQV